jgi:hypothetical protein
MIVLYANLEDMITENDRRYEYRLEDTESTIEYVVSFSLVPLF